MIRLTTLADRFVSGAAVEVEDEWMELRHRTRYPNSLCFRFERNQFFACAGGLIRKVELITSMKVKLHLNDAITSFKMRIHLCCRSCHGREKERDKILRSRRRERDEIARSI